MKLESLDKLFVDELKDIYSAESQLIRALPKMAKAASNEALRKAFEKHLAETKVQKERLETIAEKLDLKLGGKKCEAMEGLIEEGKEILEADGPEPIIDAALIAAAQRVEHYEISAYGTARALARHLGHTQAAALLDKTIQEEGDTDHKLTELAEQTIYPSVEQFLAEQEAAGSNARGSKSNGRGRTTTRKATAKSTR